GRDHETLITRTKDPHDNATPSGNSMAVTGLLRLAKLTGRSEWQDKAERTLQLYHELLEAHPMAGGPMLCALDFHLGPVQEFAVVGGMKDEDTQRVLKSIRAGFRPNKVVAVKSPGDALEDDLVPLLAGKSSAGAVTTYICENFTCQAPLLGADAVDVA